MPVDPAAVDPAASPDPFTPGSCPDRLAIPDLLGPDDPSRERRLAWAVLMKRTFGWSVLVCPACSGPMRLISAVEDPAVAARILQHLALPARPPPRGRPWKPQPELVLEQRADEWDAIDPPAFAE